MTDVVLNKIQSIQRCVKRAREIYNKNPIGFFDDFDLQDAAVLNIIRACDLSIDLANHVIKTYQLGIPNSSAESFNLLAQKGIISTEMSAGLKKMVGFRNIGVHEYRRIDYKIVESIIKTDMDELVALTDCIREFDGKNP
jgi:uncharacterized protein YutE (UPF0331/DUF86 family)